MATRPAPVEKPATISHHPAPVFAAGLVSPDWATILDSLPFGFVLLGPKQELRHENAWCRQIAGKGIAESGGVEAWLSALCPEPGHREKVIKSWREEIWRNQRTRTFTLTSPGKKPREIQFRSSLLQDGGITLSIEDVTEALRAEETQRHGKWKFRALFTHTRTGTVLVDHLGRIIEVNPAFTSLCGNSLKDLRLTPFAGLLHPDEAESLAAAEKALLASPDGGHLPEDRVLSSEVWLRTPSGEKRVSLLWSPVGESTDPPALSLYLVEVPDATDQIRAKLRTLSRKAQALLHAVPDLILLLDADGTVTDFAPPPKAWPELAPDDSWRQQPALEVWPVLGNLLNQCRKQVLEEERTIHAEIRGSGDEGYEFAVSLSPCGDGQILAVVRNQSSQRALRERDLWHGATFTHAPFGILRLDTRGLVSEANEAAIVLLGDDEASLTGIEFSEAALPRGTVAEFLALEHEGKPRGSLVFLQSSPETPSEVPLSTNASAAPTPAAVAPPRERRQHSFRNQLQLVTSLFSLEPQSAAAREAFMKWQVRLRSMALACPYDDTVSVWVFPLLRDLADEVCSLVGRGPGRREVIITGDETLTLDVQTATPFSLLIGELMRLVLGTRQHGPGPELYVNLRPHPGGGFQLTVRPGTHRSFIFTDRDSEIETLELLTEQIQGRLEPTDPGNPSKEWVLIVPQTRS